MSNEPATRSPRQLNLSQIEATLDELESRRDLPANEKFARWVFLLEEFEALWQAQQPCE